MSAKFAAPLLALGLTACFFTIPIQPTPRQIERPVAPIEEAGPIFASTCENWDEWDKPAYPVRIHGNSYLVGTCGIASILITGSAGHILIDSGTEAGAQVVLRNIRRLGFDPKDVKYILHSHEHFDHVGGIADLARETGAAVIASAEAAKVLSSGLPGPADPQFGMHDAFTAIVPDRIIHDGEQLRLGELLLTPIATPGHSPGALSWHWGSCDGANCQRIVYADSLSPVSSDDYRFSDHEEYLAAYRAGLDRLAATPCDIILTPHPSASQMIERMAGALPLIDSDGCRNYATAVGERLDRRLEEEQAE